MGGQHRFMPLYEYRCAACGHELEAVQKFSDKELTDCPNCGQSELKRLMSMSSFSLRGGGWYADGYGGAKDEGKTDAGTESGEKSDDKAKGAGKDESKKSETAKEEKKAESKKSEPKGDSKPAGGEKNKAAG